MHIGKLILALLSCYSALPVPASGQTRPPWERVRDFGGAIPKNEADWITFQDYPSAALRKGLQGNVIVAFDITAKGRVSDCVVAQSSGEASLDKVPCPLIRRRARFRPAHADDGTAIETKGRFSVAFWIPD